VSEIMQEDYENVDWGDLTLLTVTEEFFIPARLYYKIHNLDLLKKALSRLECVRFHQKDNNYFVILYGNEVRNIGLNVPCNKVSKKLQPVKLAICRIIPPDTLYCDLESKPRAVGIMDFFDKHISSTVMEITAAAISNKIFGVKKGLLPTMVVHYDKVFNENAMYHNYNPINEEIEDIGKRDLEYKAEKFYIRYNKNKPEDTLNWLTIRLGLKETMLYEHTVLGNDNCTAMDILEAASKECPLTNNKKAKKK
jgi:hypothetical protein